MLIPFRRTLSMSLLLIILIGVFITKQEIDMIQEAFIYKQSSNNDDLSDNNNININSQSITNNQEESQTVEDSIIIPKDYNPGFENPGWSCKSSSSSSTHKKLIFVHVFKTAGSSFRTFFSQYGESCGKGTTVLIGCSYLSSQSLDSPNLEEVWEPCHLKKTLTRDKKVIEGEGYEMTTSHLQQYSDIVIGHLPLGIDKNWMDVQSQTPVESQYIAFFREPIVKYVSGRLFVNEKQKWSLEQAVSEISSRIRNSYQNGEYYNAYTRYLTTPDQKEYAKSKNKLSHKQWVNVINQNIIDMHIVVGIVESMKDSLEIIQSIIDVDRDMTEHFQSLIMVPSSSSSNNNNGLVENKSRLSSSKIVSILKEDEEIWLMLNEVLKYEFEIYNFALKVHHLQVEEMKKRHGDRFSLKVV